MYKQLISEKKEQFDGAVEHFVKEIMKIRTGRAAPALVEDIMVDYYGTPTALKQAANISVPEPRQLLIAPWDRGVLAEIEAAIKVANLGVNPQNDGAVIRITLPPLNEEQRLDLVKALGRRAEDARVAVRNIREDVWKSVQDAQKSGDISEDDKFAAKDDLQKIIDDHNESIEKLRENKEKEIMTV